ncbi:MAG: hypothetical protein JKY50_04300 [Oleispira sp.]|nr:hypothetical protein [Oleispira sp.]MBL4881781.1 hypothetical protein [Oleispira sp.]
MKLRNLVPCLAASILLAACGADDDSSSQEQVGPFDPSDPIYLVKSTAWVTDAGISLHFLTNTLDEYTVFDPDTALAIPEYTGIAIPEGDNPDNAFYAGMKTSSVYRRYVVSDTGVVSLDDELDFSGVTGTIGRNLLRATQFMSPTKAYALDFAGLQIIAFNPTDMTLIDTDTSTAAIDTISLASLEEAALPGTWSVFPTTDGNRFVATIGFYAEDGSDPGVTKLVIVDSSNNSVATDSVDNCSAVTGAAKDAAGNMYFASYDEAALAHEQGRGAYAPCIIRVLAGSNEFDDSYLMNMQNLTNNGRMAMGAVTGNGDIGYNLIMSDTGQAMVTDGTLAKHLRIPVWEFHSFDLTDSNATATKVEGVVSTKGAEGIPGGTISRILNGSFNHHELGDITWMAQIDVEEISSIYNATDPATWSLITNKIPGQIEFVGRLR